jgi:hypothetical protein
MSAGAKRALEVDGAVPGAVAEALALGVVGAGADDAVLVGALFAACVDAAPDALEPPHPASTASAAVAAVAVPSSVRIRMVVPPDGEH